MRWGRSVEAESTQKRMATGAGEVAKPTSTAASKRSHPLHPKRRLFTLDRFFTSTSGRHNNRQFFCVSFFQLFFFYCAFGFDEADGFFFLKT